MVKVSGGTRKLKTGSKEWSARQKEVFEMQKLGKYSSVTFHKEGGGYVAIEKSKMKHKAEEVEAASMLASKGYKVILKDESGQVSTPDGYLFKATFEQRTPTAGEAKGFKNSLEHAKKKKAEIAVVYDKNYVYHRKDVDDGIALYESLNSYRFKQIIVIASDGKVHRHNHN